MKKSILDFKLNNKTVILRCDFNVSIKNGKIIDDSKIVKSLKTINYILDNGGRVVILSHLGKVKSVDDMKNNSLSIVFNRLNELCLGKIDFVPYCIGNEVVNSVNSLEFGRGILLENTRFCDIDGKLESSNDSSLAKFWASLGDIFINDAFGTIHRGHASNLGISTYLDSGIGFLVMEEIAELDKLDNPFKPFVVIMGGSKVSDKLSIIESLIEKVDYLLVGGAMSYTFLKAIGYNVGKSIVEDDYLVYCKNLYNKYSNKIIFPVDLYGSYSYSNDDVRELFDINCIPSSFMGLDMGDRTIDLFEKYLNNARTVFWNGPLGVYEFSNYINGTDKILGYVCENVSYSILGGGDIVSASMLLGYDSKISYLSTGGGATLEYLVNKDLPGLKNIKDM